MVLKHPNVSDFRSTHCPLPGYTLDRLLLDPCIIPSNIMHPGGQDGTVLEPGHKEQISEEQIAWPGEECCGGRCQLCPGKEGIWIRLGQKERGYSAWENCASRS